jgi:hypothetical protein
VSGLGGWLPAPCGAIPDLPVTSGASPDVPVAGVTSPDGVGVGVGVGSLAGALFCDEAGGVDEPLLPEAGGLDPPGDPDPTPGLGETLGVTFFVCCFGSGEEGVVEGGVGEDACGAGGEVDSGRAPLELAAAGEAVGGVGPLVHDDVVLVEAVVRVLDGLPDFTPLWLGSGVVAEPVGVSVGVGVTVGLCAGVDVGLCVGATVGPDVGVKPGSGAVAFPPGIRIDGQLVVGDGLGLALELALAEAAPPPWPLPGCGFPVPDWVPPPEPDPDDGPGDEPMFAIACRTPGTAAAVPPNSTIAPTTSAGLSQAVPSRCRAVRVLASAAVRARRPFAAATAANATSAAANAASAGAAAADIFFTA